MGRSAKEHCRPAQVVDGGGKVKQPEVGMGVAWAQGRKGGGGGTNPTMDHDTSIDVGESSGSLQKGAEQTGEAISEYRKRSAAKKKKAGQSGSSSGGMGSGGIGIV